MGLDQYAFARKGEEKIEIMYWRKHANLQGWMERLYCSRGGKGEDFNCVDLLLSEEDLLNLQLQHENLETATGFFWGTSRPESIADTAHFISTALEYQKQGYEITYYSWW